MGPAIKPPTKELVHYADEIYSACGVFLQARGGWARDQKWEALRTGWALSNHSLRNTEAVVALAQTDMVLLPGAWTAARASVESAARNQWLLEPDDVWEREARWVALLEEGGRLATRTAVQSRADLVQTAKQVQSFVEGIREVLPAGLVIPRIPNMEAMFTGANAERLYGFYVVASQYVHAAELSTRQWRSGLGTADNGTECVQPWHWFEPLWMAWQAFRVTARTLQILQWNENAPPDVVDLEMRMREADIRIEAARDDLLKS